MAETDSNMVQNVMRNSGNNEHNGGNLDPLFISNSDNPTSSLVSTLFTGSNSRWSMNIKRALVAKNKEGFITGSLPKPDDNDKDCQKWIRAD